MTQQSSDAPEVCVVCHLPIEKKPDAFGVISWPCDNQGPKHWDCWHLGRPPCSDDYLAQLTTFVPHKKPETPIEAAEQSVEIALDQLDVALVKLRGARERLRMVRDHELWKFFAGKTKEKQ